MWLYLGKGKCMYFTFMQRKKNTQRKHVNIKVLAWNKFCTQRAFRLFLSCTAVWPSGPLGRVPRVPRRAVPFKQWAGGSGGVTCESMMQSVTTRMTVSEARGGRTPASTPCERSMTGHVFLWTDSESQKTFCTQTVRRCLMPWLSMGDNMVNQPVAMTTKRSTFSLNPPTPTPPALCLLLSDSC